MDTVESKPLAAPLEAVPPGKLYAAVEQGNLEAVKEILLHATADDVNYQATNENQRTALAKAAITGNCEVLEEILKHPDLDPNLPNKFSVLPLMSAFTGEVTKLLLAHPQVNANEIGKVKSFLFACEEGNVSIIDVFLAHEGFNVNAQNEDGVTGLMFAATNKHVTAVQALLKHPQININMQDNNGFTALISVCDEIDCHAVIPLLLSLPDINVNLRLENGCTALSMVCGSGLVHAVKLLLEVPSIDVNLPNCIGHTPLLKASDQGHKDICALLLSRPDVDANVQSQDGFTALICAAQHGHVEIVNALLKFACFPSGAANQEWKALCPATYSNQPVTALAFLKNHFINVNLKSNAGYSALNMACDNLHVECAKLLLAIPGIDVNVQNEEGHTPLTVSSFKGGAEVVQLLLLHPEIDVNKGRYPPLLAACASVEANVDVVKALLVHPKIDVNKTMEDGACTALLMACNFNHTEIVCTILEMSDNVDVDIVYEAVDADDFDRIVNKEIQQLLREYRTRKTQC